jgi:hypothetical protein
MLDQPPVPSFKVFRKAAVEITFDEKNRKEQRRILDGHLAFLDEAGYLEGDALTSRGKIAKQINGYELQVTELLFSGALAPAAALSGRAGTGKIVCVVSGGNINLDKLAEILGGADG